MSDKISYSCLTQTCTHCKKHEMKCVFIAKHGGTPGSVDGVVPVCFRCLVLIGLQLSAHPARRIDISDEEIPTLIKAGY